MTQYIGWIAAGFFVAAQGAALHAQVITAPIASPVDHPVVAAQPVHTRGAWRQGVGRFGESLASGSLRFRGYEVIDIKLPGNRGIDLVAVKRNAAGIVTDIRLVEVKAHRGKSGPRLGQTRVGTQMSRQWLADRLGDLGSSGEQGRKLALDISRFRKAKGVPLERLGEVHDVNLRTGKYTIRNPVNMAVVAGPMSIERLLKKIFTRSRDPILKDWAMRHLSQFDQIRQTSMNNWLHPSSSSRRAFDRVSSTQLVLLQERQALRGARRVLVVAAGPLAAAAATAMDGYEIYGLVRDYRLGKLSQKEFIIALARSGGGIAGAWTGATAGAWLGWKIGLSGGPWAWLTVPVGSVIGGAVGGIAGYFGGSYVGESSARAWYDSLDRNVRERVSEWFKNATAPTGT